MDEISTVFAITLLVIVCSAGFDVMLRLVMTQRCRECGGIHDGSIAGELRCPRCRALLQDVRRSPERSPHRT